MSTTRPSKGKYARDFLLGLYRTMVRIRACSQQISAWRAHQGQGPVLIGQEAAAAGVAAAMQSQDILICADGHCHCHGIARGMEPQVVMASLFGAPGRLESHTPPCFGGDDHGATGHALSAGSALTSWLMRDKCVTVGCLNGDDLGAPPLLEVLQVAAAGKAPLVWFLQRSAQGSAPSPASPSWAAAVGVPFVSVDGCNATEVYAAVKAALEHARRGKGPYVVEARIHTVAPEKISEVDRDQDGIAWMKARLRSAGTKLAEMDLIHQAAEEEMAQAAASWEKVSAPRPAAAARRGEVSKGQKRPPSSLPALVQEEMRRDETLIALGNDGGRRRGIFSLRAELSKELGPRRMVDVPLSAPALWALAAGMALRGLRPYVEMDADAPSALGTVSPIARWPYPLVLHLPMDAPVSEEALVCRIPGLRVAAVSSPSDLQGLLRSALEEPGPTMLLTSPSPLAETGRPMAGVPLGCAALRREGQDAAVITWGGGVETALQAAERLSALSLEVQVVDLRTLEPLDWEAVRQSVLKTHNVVVVSREQQQGSYAAALSARIAEELFDELDAPVTRLWRDPQTGNAPTPEAIAAAVRRMLNK